MEVYARRANDKRTHRILISSFIFFPLYSVARAGSSNSGDNTSEQAFRVHNCTQSHFDGVILEIRWLVLWAKQSKTTR